MTTFHPTPPEMTALFGLLKQIYPPDSVLSERRENLLALVRHYGYLPWSHQRALDELSAAEALLVVDEKLRQNGIYADSGFVFSAEMLSLARRAGYTDSSWMKMKGHEIKLINLAALGNGKTLKEPGQLWDWVMQFNIIQPT